MRLTQIQEALDRLQSGGYGICLCCEERIPTRRLRALPWAKSSPAFDAEKNKAYAFDLAKAKSLVAQSGTSDSQRVWTRRGRSKESARRSRAWMEKASGEPNR